MKLAIIEQFRLATQDNFFEVTDYADAITHINFKMRIIFLEIIFIPVVILQNIIQKIR